MMIAGGLNNNQMENELTKSGVKITFDQQGSKTFLQFDLDDRNGFVLDNTIGVGEHRISFTAGTATGSWWPRTPA